MKKQAIFITMLSAMLLASCNIAKPVKSSQSVAESSNP